MNINWRPVPHEPLADPDLTRERAVWLVFIGEEITVGRVVANGKGSWRPHHWNTILGAPRGR